MRTHTQLSPATSHRAQLHFSKFPQPLLVPTTAPATHPLALSELRGLGPTMATWFLSPGPGLTARTRLLGDGNGEPQNSEHLTGTQPFLSGAASRLASVSGKKGLPGKTKVISILTDRLSLGHVCSAPHGGRANLELAKSCLPSLRNESCPTLTELLHLGPLWDY